MRKTRDIARLKRWCIRRRGEGVPVIEICAAAQLPRRTFYDWWRRYRQHGLEGLTPKSRRPHTIHRTPNQVANEVITIRQKTAWCPHKIAGYLRTQGTPVGHMTVYRILRSSGLNRPLTKPRTRRPYKRWQRKRSNSLWQCDLKLVGAEWLITPLDDHSVRGGESNFDTYCQRQRIKHILGGIGKPTTQGKIERWFRTYDLEHARFELHRKFIHYYNYERPHMALNYKTTAEVYFQDVQHVLG